MPEPVTDDVGAVVGRGVVLAHRDRHRLDDLAVAPDGQRLGVVVGGRDHLVADGEVRRHVLLAEQAVAEVDAVGVDRDVDRRARLPVLRWAPTHFAVVQPVEGTLDGRVGGDGDRPLRRQPVRDVLVEADRDGLADADDLAVVRAARRASSGSRANASGTSSAGWRHRRGRATAPSACSACCSRAARWCATSGRRGSAHRRPDALVVVDHRDRAEDTVLGADRHGLIHRHTDGAVLDRRGELGHQQVAERRALVVDDLRLRRSRVAAARAEAQDQGRHHRDGHQTGTKTTRTGHVIDLPHTLLQLVTGRDSTGFLAIV